MESEPLPLPHSSHFLPSGSGHWVEGIGQQLFLQVLTESLRPDLL